MRLPELTFALLLLTACDGAFIASAGLSEEFETPLTPTPASETFVYRVGPSSDSIRRASLDPATAWLREHAPTALADGSAPVDLAVSPDANFLFVANSGTLTIETYSLDRTTGEPTLAFSRSTAGEPVRLLMDPLGRFLFELEDDAVVTYLVAVTGELTWQSSVAVTGGGRALGIDDQGKFLYVSSTGDGTLSYDIDAVTGDLTNPSAAEPAAAEALKVTAATTRLYAPSTANGDILLFSVVPATGVPTFSSFLSTAAASPLRDIVFAPGESHLYTVVQEENRVQAFAVNSVSGALSLIGAVTLPDGCRPSSLAIDPDSDFLFTGCTDESGKTFVMQRNPNGSLTLKTWTKINTLNAGKIVLVTF